MNKFTEFFFPYKPEMNEFMFSNDQIEYDKCEQGLPIPPKEHWLGYGKDQEEHLSDAKYDVDIMLDILKKSGFSLDVNQKILDFGCGAGRMMRWLKPYSEFNEIWGVDINSELIFWANQYLNPPFNFVTTTTIPHLPFEDKYFDFIYSGSVFTHIDDLKDAWLLELRRILSKNGRLFLTIHDFNTIKELDTNPLYNKLWLKNHMNECELYVKNKYKFSVLVYGRGPASQVFYDLDYFCQSLQSYFEILSTTINAYGHQSGILLKRK